MKTDKVRMVFISWWNIYGISDKTNTLCRHRGGAKEDGTFALIALYWGRR